MQVAAFYGILANRYTIIVLCKDAAIGVGECVAADHKSCRGIAGVATREINGMPAPIYKRTVLNFKTCCINTVAIDQ